MHVCTHTYPYALTHRCWCACMCVCLKSILHKRKAFLKSFNGFDVVCHVLPDDTIFFTFTSSIRSYLAMFNTFWSSVSEPFTVSVFFFQCDLFFCILIPSLISWNLLCSFIHVGFFLCL